MSKKLLITLMILAAVTLVLAACGEADESAGGTELNAASIQAGEDLFARSVIGSQAGCIACHSLEPGVALVGPSMAGIGSRAGDTVPGQSAEEYLRESIVSPDAYLVEGYPEGVMPEALGEELTSEQIDDLVAYMLSLE